MFFFSDGTSEKATCTTNDLDVATIETGVALCILKKMFGGSTDLGSNLYNKIMHHVYQLITRKMADQEAKEKAAQEESERAERKRQKTKRKAEKRRAKQREEEIEAQKEVCLRVMR